MPQAANIVINDGAATPVAHTFTPLGKDEKGVFWFVQVAPASANALGAKRIGISISRPTNGNRLSGNARVVLSLWNPVLETLGTNSAGIVPPPTLAYQCTDRQTFDLPERSTKQERKDTRVLMKNLLDNALVVSCIEDLLSVY